MTYYRVDFLATQPVPSPANRFRTPEKARQHARRILGLADDSGLAVKSRSLRSAGTALQSKCAEPFNILIMLALTPSLPGYEPTGTWCDRPPFFLAWRYLSLAVLFSP
jgi:hypothetical protein